MGAQGLQQIWERYFHGIPDHIEIHVEIAMRDSVAHASHAPPWNVRVGDGIGFMMVHDLGRCFADDDQIHDHGELRALIVDERCFRQAFDETASFTSCLPPMIEVVVQPAFALRAVLLR